MRQVVVGVVTPRQLALVVLEEVGAELGRTVEDPQRTVEHGQVIQHLPNAWATRMSKAALNSFSN